MWKRILEALIAKEYSMAGLGLNRVAVDTRRWRLRKGARRIRRIRRERDAKIHVTKGGVTAKRGYWHCRGAR